MSLDIGYKSLKLTLAIKGHKSVAYVNVPPQVFRSQEHGLL